MKSIRPIPGEISYLRTRGLSSSMYNSTYLDKLEHLAILVKFFKLNSPDLIFLVSYKSPTGAS